MGPCTPSSLSPNQDILADPVRQKFVDILTTNGITDEVDRVIMTEIPELKGEHMATATVYVTVEFMDKSIAARNLFIKKFTSSQGHTEFIKEFRLMEKESSFFIKFLPNAREFLKGFNGGANLLEQFPKCFYGDDEMLVLENLVLDKNFIMLSKEERQDLRTAKNVLTNLAKFHAASYAFINMECGGSAKFRKDWDVQCYESFLGDKNKTMDSMIENGITSCINMLKNFPVDGGDDAICQLGKFHGKVSGMLENLLTPNITDKLLVLNHGDCWNNNMLFKKDAKTGLVTDHIFCDLQLTRLGSPNLDIGYFLFTSVKSNLRREHLTDCLKHYFSILEESLAIFGLKCVLTFEEFADDFAKTFQLGFLINLIMITAVGAFKDIDQECMADPERMKIEFDNAIKKWVTLNPEKAKDVSHEIIEVLKEHAKILECGAIA